jgi:catechol 2,3-dioxygenase-like lactoylglutathione lyase family enzyme
MVIPCLRARDLAETVAFYERLGFAVSGRYEENGETVWCELARDEARLQFHILDHPEMPSHPIISGVLYFRPDNVRALAEEWRGRVDFYWGPEVMKYGWREFAFRDPNGYIIAFTEPTSDPPDCDGA